MAKQPLKLVARSKMHMRVAELLAEAFPAFRVQHEVPISVTVDGRPTTLRVDMMLPELDVCIECHGRQHGEYVPHFHGNKQGFVNSQIRDRVKADMLKSAGYTMVVVSHNEWEQLSASSLLTRIHNTITGTVQ
jgi:hypothetical protein